MRKPNKPLRSKDKGLYCPPCRERLFRICYTGEEHLGPPHLRRRKCIECGRRFQPYAPRSSRGRFRATRGAGIDARVRRRMAELFALRQRWCRKARQLRRKEKAQRKARWRKLQRPRDRETVRRGLGK